MFVLLALIVFFYAMYYTGASNWRTNGAAQMTLGQAIGLPQSITSLLAVTSASPGPPPVQLNPDAQAVLRGQQPAATSSQNTGGSLGKSIQSEQIGLA